MCPRSSSWYTNLIIVEKHATPDRVELDLGDVDGWEHVLEHGRHQLDLTFLTGKSVHDKQGMVLELLFVSHLTFEGGSESM